jgi:hypothetical protein
LTCFALCVAQAVYLVASYGHGLWLIDGSGQPIATDFVNVWAGGRQVLEGNAAAVYDGVAHKAAEVAAVGHPFDGDYPWIYPPTFLFAAALLALFPYVSAYAAWVLLTFPALLATVRQTVGDRIGIFFACAYPGILSNFVVGQNGFVTAALLGGVLLAMQRRPLLAGCLLGLLSFKPHLGILFPLVLIADARWRVMAAATGTVALLIVASGAAFGWETWLAFFQALPVASRAALSDGLADWGKLQSVFGLVRVMGGSENLAWALQGTLAAVTAFVLWTLWQSKMSFEVKAAALATGSLLTTPYLFMYDLVVLAVPMAFLLRAKWRTGSVAGEMFGLAAASVLILVFPLIMAPVGLAAVLIVALLIARRAWVTRAMAEVPLLADSEDPQNAPAMAAAT